MNRIPTWMLWAIVATSAMLAAGHLFTWLVAKRPLDTVDAALAILCFIVFGAILYGRLRRSGPSNR